ncbi:MAG: recombinase RecA [Myxococcales bacterium]|nr:recombinase RecA [Myxococcales bacterium]
MTAPNQDRFRAVKSALALLEKQFGKGTVMTLDDTASEPCAVISTGSLGLDRALGVGGYPRGRIIEIYGPESSGKTTLTLHAIAEVQRAGGVAAFIDAEHALDTQYARNLGIDLASLVISQPDTGEQALEVADALVRSGAIDLIVIDSVAALVPKAELEGDMGDQHVGLQARLMSQALRKLTSVAHRNGVCIVFINQIRTKIGVMFGNPETTTGGNALKFYASVRLDVRRVGSLKAGDDVIGARTRVKVVKNKLAPPFKESEFDVRYGTGIDATAELIDLATELGVIEKSGSHLSLFGTHLGNGRDRAREALQGNRELQSKLRASLAGPRPGSASPRAEAQ